MHNINIYFLDHSYRLIFSHFKIKNLNMRKDSVSVSFSKWRNYISNSTYALGINKILSPIYVQHITQVMFCSM